ncbi:MAG: hypothetical protein H6576_13890 [Lewinellaceae bacterium]|nr:hypothetical protein [Lewinellaceae bacterium]
MKKINIVCQVFQNYILALVFVLLSIVNTHAQAVSTKLGAIGYNGKITIRVDSLSTIPTYFLVNNNSIDLDFYFEEDDPRNGIHSGILTAQPSGEVYFSFSDLPYQQGDTLSFSTTEELSGTTTKYYVFVRGGYFPKSGGPINTCPTHFECTSYVKESLFFYFDPNEIILDPSVFFSNSSISVIIPGTNFTFSKESWGISIDKNAIIVSFIPPIFDCNEMMLGFAQFTINGMTCTFENGELICPPWADIPENLDGDCADFFDNCILDYIDLLSENQNSIACKQWVDFDQCSTNSLIHRQGNVAIGTMNFSPNAALTVKNGVITDRVKVTNIGWADYVFDKNYELKPLEEVDAYIKKYGHLPGTRSSSIVETEGSVELGETTINQQEKIEEIFLYLIKLEKEVSELEAILFVEKALTKAQLK